MCWGRSCEDQLNCRSVGRRGTSDEKRRQFAIQMSSPDWYFYWTVLRESPSRYKKIEQILSRIENLFKIFWTRAWTLYKYHRLLPNYQRAQKVDHTSIILKILNAYHCRYLFVPSGFNQIPIMESITPLWKANSCWNVQPENYSSTVRHYPR